MLANAISCRSCRVLFAVDMRSLSRRANFCACFIQTEWVPFSLGLGVSVRIGSGCPFLLTYINPATQFIRPFQVFWEFTAPHSLPEVTACKVLPKPCCLAILPTHILFFSFVFSPFFLGCPMIDLSACNAPASLSTQYNSEFNAHIVSGWLMFFLLFAIPFGYGFIVVVSLWVPYLSIVIYSFSGIVGITFLVR